MSTGLAPRMETTSVLKFRTAAGRAAHKPRNYLAHKFQRPFWFLILIFAVGLWIARGGDPSRWQELFKFGNRTTAQNATTEPVDNRVAVNAVAPAPGEVQAAPGEDKKQPVAVKRLFGNVRPELFTALEDDAVYRRDEEQSFFQLLRALDEADERDIEVASVGERTFRQLNEQTKEYRGEIVDVAGTVHRIIPQKANQNLHGIDKYYEVWIQPEKSIVPLVFVCLELPKDYPSGDVMQKVRASGYFYKRLGYASEPDPKTGEPVFRSSPLVLAKTFRWTPKAKIADAVAAGEEAVAVVPGLPRGIPTKWVLPLLGFGMVLMIALAVWAFRLSRTSVASRGPFVGRLRREAEEAEAAKNLNKIKIEP